MTKLFKENKIKLPKSKVDHLKFDWILKMKKILVAGLLLVFPLTFVSFGLVSVEALNPLEGKIVALDAGHGGEELGAVNEDVVEKDVNLAVVYALKNILERASSTVVLTRECDETISSRKSRVDLAIEECKTQYGRKCDVLVSVHHNGSTDPNYDGLLVIYNEKQDKPLAIALHDALWNGLTHNPNGYVDEGLDHGGYGMTVYGHLVSALTEAYYITNNWEAQQYLNGTLTQVCDEKSVLIGDRIDQEAYALYQGLSNYFSAPPPKPPRR